MSSEVEHPSFEILGFKFAPLSIPMNRRFQTFCVLFFTIVGFFLGPALFWFMVYMTLFTNYWYLPLVYVCWYVYDRKTPFQGGRKHNALRKSSLAYGLRDYFPAKLVKTAELPNDKNYLFGAYPHGVICFGVSVNFGLEPNFVEVFPDLEPHIISLAGMFNVPVSREAFLDLGVCAATEESILNILNSEEKGKVAVLLVGGSAEVYLSEPGTNRIILNKRKGFVRVAFKAGTPLVPVYTFGENDLYNQVRSKRLHRIQESIRNIIGVFPIVLQGRGIFQYSFGLLPHRHPLTTVVGKPIPVPKIENPTQEQIDEVHQKFKTELIKLFNEYKGKYDSQGNKAELEIVE